jgi:hypothetical protein
MSNERKQGRPLKGEENRTEKVIIQTFVTPELNSRIVKYLETPLSSAKNKRDLFQQAIEQFLDEEEKVLHELIVVRDRLRKQSK